MKQRIRLRDGRNLDRDLGPGGEHHDGSTVRGDPLTKVEDRKAASRGVPLGYSTTKPGVIVKWR